jgi:hypothetical protein
VEPKLYIFLAPPFFLKKVDFLKVDIYIMPITSIDSFEKCEEYFKDVRLLSEMRKPDELKQKLQTIKEKTPYILEEFKNTYVAYYKNPEYQDYQQMFANIQSNVTNINSELFTILNEANFYTDELNKKIAVKKAELDRLKIEKSTNETNKRKEEEKKAQQDNNNDPISWGLLRRRGIIIIIIYIYNL